VEKGGETPVVSFSRVEMAFDSCNAYKRSWNNNQDAFIYKEFRSDCLSGAVKILKEESGNMEHLEKKNCSFEDMIFSHGLRRCEEEKCLVCNDGKWVDPLELASTSSRRGIYVAPGKDLSDI
jgi:hypothetical protein